METLGNRIRYYRKLKGLTQRELADKVGAKHNSVSDWENDKNKPDAEMIEHLMYILEVDANALLKWDKPEQVEKDAEELVSKIMSNPEIKKMIPYLDKMSRDELELVFNLIEKISKEG